MRTSNVALLAEIDILELRIGIDANELEVVKEFDRMTDEIAELRAKITKKDEMTSDLTEALCASVDEIAELRELLLRKSSHAANLEHEISQLCTEKAELIHALLELSEWKPIESYENALYEAKELLAKHK